VFRSQLPTARSRFLRIGRFPPVIVRAVRARGLWLIEEHLPPNPSRKRHEGWVLHERCAKLCLWGSKFATPSDEAEGIEAFVAGWLPPGRSSRRLAMAAGLPVSF